MESFARTGAYQQPSDADRYQLIRDYYVMLVAEDTPGAIGKMKQFASWFTHGVRNGAELRRGVQSAQSPQEVLARVDDFFRNILSPAAAEARLAVPAISQSESV
jgi:tRNA-dihydrouridine synthase